jgi:hypothetical protein
VQPTASKTFYPPAAYMHRCMNNGCKCTAKCYALKKADTCTVWLYTLDEGPLPAYAVHLYCEGKPKLNSLCALVLTSIRVQDQLSSQFLRPIGR